MRALRILAMASLACLVVATALGAWLHLNDWRLPWDTAPEGELPVIKASPTPHKERPEDPGGYQPENLGVGILESAGGREPEGPVRLLPPPEEPMRRPGEEPATGEAAPDAGRPERLPVPSGRDPAAEEEGTAPAGEAEGTVAAEAETTTAPAGAAAETAPAEAGPASPPEAEAIAMVEPPAAEEEEAASAPGAPVPPGPKPALPQAGRAEPPPPSDGADAAGAPGVWIQLASLGEPGPAEREWRRLERKHPEILGPLRERRTEQVALNDGRVLFRLQAGTFADADGAKAVCTALKAEGTDCFVVDPR